MAWKSSLFVNVQNDLVEIKEHGWNPLNYSLLDSDDIKLTMTKNDVSTTNQFSKESLVHHHDLNQAEESMRENKA